MVLGTCSVGRNGATAAPMPDISSMPAKKTLPAARCRRPPLGASMATGPETRAVDAPPMCRKSRLAAAALKIAGAWGLTWRIIDRLLLKDRVLKRGCWAGLRLERVPKSGSRFSKKRALKQKSSSNRFAGSSQPHGGGQEHRGEG